MEENRKGTGVFYAVVGVATLVVAIIGATFAYFSASKSVTDVVKGNAATAGMTLSVAPVSTGATGGLVPIADGTAEAPYNKNLLNNALTATTMCVDDDGNTVCQLYKITVKNDGNAPARFDGTLALTAAEYTNLKWANINKNSGLDSTTAPNPVDAGSNLNAATETSITSNELYAGGAEKVYYVLVYIAETGESQNESDKGSFTGVVTFNSAGGQGTTAKFGTGV